MCARSRLWASLRVDGELSELEGARLDSHLSRCSDCRSFAELADTTTRLVRAAPLEEAPALVVRPPASPRGRFVLAGVAAVVTVGALIGGLVHGGGSSGVARATKAGGAVAVVAGVETADQMRELRRNSLILPRPLPRDLSGQPT